MPKKSNSKEPIINQLEIERNGNVLQFVVNPTYEQQLAAVKSDGMALQFIEEPSFELIWTALQKNGAAIQFVKNQKVEYCDLAVHRTPSCLQWIRDQTEKQILISVKAAGLNIRFAQFQNETIAWAAIQQDATSLRAIENLTFEMAKVAVNEWGSAIQYIHEQNIELIKIAVRREPAAFVFVQDKTTEIRKIAFTENPEITKFENFRTQILKPKYVVDVSHLNNMKVQTESEIIFQINNQTYDSSLLAFVKKQTHKICLESVSKYGKTLRYVHNKTEDIVLAAIANDHTAMAYVSNKKFSEQFFIRCMKVDGRCLAFSKMRTPAIEMAAVKQNWEALQYVTEPTEQLCIEAYSQDVRALRYLWNEVGFGQVLTSFSFNSRIQKVETKLDIDRDYLEKLTALSVQRELECQIQALTKDSITKITKNRRMDVL